MIPSTPARRLPEEGCATIRFRSLTLLLLLLAASLSTSCQQEVGSGIPLPTLIPTAGPGTLTPASAPTSVPAPTSAPAPTAGPLPTGSSTASPAAAAVPTVGMPAVYPAMEPNNASEIHQVAQTTSNRAIRLTWSILGNSLAVVTRSDVSILDASSFSVMRTVAVPPQSRILDFSSDGSTLATLVGQNQVELTDLNSGKQLRTLSPGVQFTEGIFAPDGETFAIGPLEEIAVTMWDTVTGKQIRKLTGFKTSAPVYSFSFGPYGRTLIWQARATVQLQDVSTGQLGHAFHHQSFVRATALAPIGQVLAAAVPGSSTDRAPGTVKLWDAASGKEVATLDQNNGLARSLAFSPDGRLLAATSGDTIELWDVNRREIATTLLGHTGSMDLVAFSPDGTLLASASDDGTVRLWRLPPLK